ncbi:MAG: tetratricopeptide repeat protein [Verrucomicrobiales bacterium]|nr:tetratricopeptide repeat protein [Verrucomicrobiales bacterium]
MSFEVQDFDREVIQRSHEVPVLVDFWAPWCGPCRTLGPVLERLARTAGGRWELVKVNTEEHQELALDHAIRSIPAVKLFVNGGVKDEFLGALPEAEIRRWIERNLPSPLAASVAEARQELAGRRFAAVRDRLIAVLESEPGNEEARLLLAESLLHTAPAEVAAALGPVEATSEQAERADALRTLSATARLGQDPARLPAGKGRDSFASGARAVFAGDWAGALEALIEVVERDKGYADGAAPAACRAIFRLLGMRHVVVGQFHRRFSSALHA